MVAPAVAYAAIAAVSAIGSAVSSSSASKANARRTQMAAMFNSQQTLAAGLANANAITAAVNASNAATWAVAQIGADDTWDIAQYNANVRMVVGDYNANVLQQEAFYVWEAANADTTLIERELSRTRGNILTSYGASGAQINETDAVAMALTDAGTEAGLNTFIVRHSADIQAVKLRNESARSRWDGYAAAQQILYEGGMGAMSQYAQAGINVAGNTAQGRIDASMTAYNAKINAANIFSGGQADSIAYNAQGKQAMANGMFQAGGAIASSYIANKMPASTPTGDAARVSNYSSMPMIGNTTQTTAAGNRYSASLEPIYTSK